MADKSMILSAEAEAALLKPIDEYVGKIQKQIDALRVDGSDKVRSLKNHIAIAKEDKNLTKEERAKIIAKDKADLEKAKSVESAIRIRYPSSFPMQRAISPSITRVTTMRR